MTVGELIVLEELVTLPGDIKQLIDQRAGNTGNQLDALMKIVDRMMWLIRMQYDEINQLKKKLP
jgi:hypothetical protein